MHFIIMSSPPSDAISHLADLRSHRQNDIFRVAARLTPIYVAIQHLAATDKANR